MKKLAVITIVYENYRVTQEFIECFKTVDQRFFKIFMADLSQHRKKIPAQSWLEVMESHNAGYAHGVNVGLTAAIREGFERFVVINNDTRVNPDFVRKALVSIDKHRGSLIGGKIYYETGFEYHKTKYTADELGKVIWYAGGIVDWQNVYTRHRGVDEIDKGQYDQFGQNEFITGCLMLFDKKVIDTVGQWDEGYFLYYEDADFCERAKQKGVFLYYDPSVVIWHKNAQSTGGAGSSLHHQYQEKNRLKFGLKYAPWRTKIHLIKNFLTDWARKRA